jgi:hypothetical protein
VRVLEAPTLPGLRVSALGPSRDADVIRDMDPPAGESYLRMSSEGTDGDERPAPFPDAWTIAPRELAADEELKHLLLSSYQRSRVNALADEDLFGVAVALEKAVNGTSLVLMFELGNAVLLFPGDAQWGTWRRILDDREARELVERTTFLKVGHHGSHNATPRRLVQLFEERRPEPRAPVDDLSVMVSTHRIKMWEKIPKAELLAALGGLTPSLARSDEAGTVSPGFTHSDELYIDAEVPIR